MLMTITPDEQESITQIMTDVLKREWKYQKHDRGLFKVSPVVLSNLEETLNQIGAEAYQRATHAIAMEGRS